MTYKKGFTLIEMLVVVSLIGILAGLALVSFSSVQKQARDATRKSDLKQYQTATESYASKNNGNYPIANPAQTASSGTYCTALNIGTCPPDPKSPTLDYRYVSDGVNYVIWGTLENKTPAVYWVGCSNGKVAERTSAPPSNSAVCPIP
jgi:prepilin-type N-terminal cleavage/methylation domain-containing protein